MNLFKNKNIKSNDKENGKIKMMPIKELKFDRDFKNVFQQETDKVLEIASDMKANGFDKTCHHH